MPAPGGVIRAGLLQTLWRGMDPFADVRLMPVDVAGWNSDHPFMRDAIRDHRPGVVVELGVWKGAGTIVLANEIKAAGLDGAVIAVDTWLGSAEHWLDPQVPRRGDGASSLYPLFLSNVKQSGLASYVVPLPLDSGNAAAVLGHHKIRPSVIHIDGAHDLASVRRDLEAWWPLLAPGGVLIADDYGIWPDVNRAIDAFRETVEHRDFEAGCPKCRMVKV